MARTYKRDSRGRFAGGGGGGSRSAGRKPLQRGVNRLTRDNAGRITSQGGSGATARGGRLRTASGNKRATVTARGIGRAPAGTVSKAGKVKGAARVKAAGRRAPLTGVNAVVARNPAGFKGLPVSLRSRSEAAAAQSRRTRSTIESTRSQVIGSRRGVTTTAGGGQKIRIRKVASNQPNLFGGSDRVANTIVSAVPKSRAAAPGSRSARRAAGIARRANESAESRMKRVADRASGSSDRKTAGIAQRRSERSPFASPSSKKSKQSAMTQAKAAKYLYSKKNRR